MPSLQTYDTSPPPLLYVYFHKVVLIENICNLPSQGHSASLAPLNQVEGSEVVNADSAWFDCALLHINPCRLFNAKSSLYIYSKYIYI